MKLVTLPLSATNMVELFDARKNNESILYCVDLEETLKSMNERAIILYLSNLQIPCVFTALTESLVLEYLQVKEFIHSPQLAYVHANILHFVKYQEVLYEQVLEDFDLEAICSLVKNNADLIATQCTFLDSMFLYAVTRSLPEPSEQTLTANVIEEPSEHLGFPLFSLISLDDFLMCYSVDIPPVEDQIYYSRYFDDHMFKGNSLFQIAHRSSFMGLISLSMISCSDDKEDAVADLVKYNDSLLEIIDNYNEANKA